jgi:Glycosyl transferase family 2
MTVPILIICYNNYKYVDNMIKQLIKINPNLKDDIYIVNNSSTCEETIKYLDNADTKIIQNNSNNGPWISRFVNTHIYDEMPNHFILTDADLQINPELPYNFVEILVNLSIKHDAHKIGFALDISDFNKMYQGNYAGDNVTIYDWEKQYWEKKVLEETEYELYSAEIDTTFCCINKSYNDFYRQYRIGGVFTAKHIPWYIDNKFYSLLEIYNYSINAKEISTISRLVIPYVENNFLKVYKNNELFLISRNDNDLQCCENTEK